MTILAFRFREVQSRRCRSSHDILPRTNKSQVPGIATSPNIAQMVKNINIFALAGRNGTNKPCVEKPMSIKSFMMMAYITIARGIKSTGPQPTSTFFIKIYSLKNLSRFSRRYVVNYQCFHMSIISYVGGNSNE